MKKINKRWLALIIASSLLLSSVAVGLGLTYAAPDPLRVRLTQPNSYVNVVEKDRTEIRNAGGLNVARISDTALAEATYISNVSYSITGKKAGTVAVAVSTKSIAANLAWQVTDSTLLTGYDLATNGELNRKTGDQPFNINDSVTPYTTPWNVVVDGEVTNPNYQPNTEAGNAAKADIKWSSRNPEVAACAPDGSVTIESKGTTVLQGEFTDRWGVPRVMTFVLGVDTIVGKSMLSDLLDAIKKGETILNLDPNPYQETGLGDLQIAVDDGKTLLFSYDPQDEDIQNAIDAIEDAIAALELIEVIDSGIIKVPDPDNPDGFRYFKKTGTKNVYEEVDSNGDSFEPEEKYIYDENGSLEGEPPALDGDEEPAYKNGYLYYVEEDPEGSNIFVLIDQETGLKDYDGAIWGGGDRRPGPFGSVDDRPAAKDAGTGIWYAEDPANSNLWKPVFTAPGPDQGDLDENKNNWRGGGSDGKPGGNNDLYGFVEKYGELVAGPFSDTNDNGQEYFIGTGDARFDTSGDGTGTPVGHNAHPEDLKLYDVGYGLSPVKPNPDAQIATDLRTVDGGDGSDWLEIATHGGYSLILRINALPAPYSPTAFGSDNNYSTSTARTNLNNWYDTVDEEAPIWTYAVTSNVMQEIDVVPPSQSPVSGMSVPSGILAEGAQDTAFLLSHAEAHSYCSQYNGVENFNQLEGTSVRWWLRTKSTYSGGSVCLVEDNGSINLSAAFNNSNRALRPALWVQSSIFDQTPQPSSVTGRRLPASLTGGDDSDWIEIAQSGGSSLILRANVLSAAPVGGSNPFGRQNFCMHTGPGQGCLEDKCDDWANPNFNNTRVKINQWYASALSPTEGLRIYAMTNNALTKKGSYVGFNVDLASGYSSPIALAGGGNTADIAFLLSAQEAGKYCASSWYTAPGSNSFYSTFGEETWQGIALTNLHSLDDRVSNGGWWLRSPGYTTTSAKVSVILAPDGGSSETDSWQAAALRPALWVDSSIFDQTPPGFFDDPAITSAFKVVAYADTNGTISMWNNSTTPLSAPPGTIYALITAVDGNAAGTALWAAINDHSAFLSFMPDYSTWWSSVPQAVKDAAVVPANTDNSGTNVDDLAAIKASTDISRPTAAPATANTAAFALSVKEAYMWGMYTGLIGTTDVTASNAIHWLRSSNNSSLGWAINTSGLLTGSYPKSGERGVRPALWVKIAEENSVQPTPIDVTDPAVTSGFKVVAYAGASGDITTWNTSTTPLSAPTGTKYALIVATEGTAAGVSQWAGINNRSAFNTSSSAYSTWWDSVPLAVRNAAAVPASIPDNGSNHHNYLNDWAEINASSDYSRPTTAKADANNAAFALSAKELAMWGNYSNTGAANSISAVSDYIWWTRSSHSSVGGNAWRVAANGELSHVARTTVCGVRPAMWIEVEGSSESSRVLTAAKAGDSSDWIEIATEGDYSLIVRQKVVAGNVEFGGIGIESYADSYAREFLNDWFEDTLGPGTLRTKAMKNDALLKCGTSSTYGEHNNAAGLSTPQGKPTQTLPGRKDTAFLLSFQEAALYISDTWQMKGGNETTDSSPSAKNNWNDLDTHKNLDWWLRSPGPLAGNIAWVTDAGIATYATGPMYTRGIRPALWVESDIFDIQPPSPPLNEIIFGITISGDASVEANLGFTNHPYTATVDGLAPFTDSADWTVTGIPGAVMLATPGKTAYLRLPAGAEGSVTITATAVGDSSVSISKTVEVTNPSLIQNKAVGESFTMDNIEWIILAKNRGPGNNDLLILSKYVLLSDSVAFDLTWHSEYTGSNARPKVNAMYAGLNTLQEYAINPDFGGNINADNITNSKGTRASSNDDILFLLSWSDAKSATNFLNAADRIGYSLENPSVAKTWWLRSIYSNTAYCITPSGSDSNVTQTLNHGLRPAMYVRFVD
ncbi:MAG: DUF6273 domain-containing protein [Oscillospiraceae bacterium]|nr:DUF6273 domain-containing protein [Oscillospiraceae bacterium]